MAQRGYPGIHAGMPTAQCLRSAVVVNGARRSKAKQKQGGLIADLSLSAVELNLWEQSLLAMAVLRRVHIHCCGNGHLGFRPYGGSLFFRRQKK